MELSTHRDLYKAIKESLAHLHDSNSGPKCERCRNYKPIVGYHCYWPAWRLCSDCIRTLLEIKTPPHIQTGGEPHSPGGDYYVCKDEREWFALGGKLCVDS